MAAPFEKSRRMLDLFCGRFGWGKAFVARGWEVDGVDLVEPPEIPQGCRFFKSDILGMWIDQSSSVFVCGGEVHRLRGFDFICASSPCEEFSTMRNFRPPVPHPTLGMRLFEHTRKLCELSGLPYVMENVSGAGRYVGKPVAHCGSYYLWGTGVPPILPPPIRKGMTELAMGLREHKGKPGWDVRHGKKGKTPTALVATIPEELANCVAEYAGRITEAAIREKLEREEKETGR